MGDGVSSPYEGFFVMGYVEELPRSSMHPEGIVLHFEPERHPCTAFYIACQTQKDSVLEQCLDRQVFDFDKRKAVPLRLEGLFGSEWYAVVPGREKSLPHLRDLYRSRVDGVEFTPMPEIFPTMHDYREFLTEQLPVLHRVHGNILNAPWYNNMADELQGEMEDAYIRKDKEALKDSLRRWHTCFPWDSRMTDDLMDAAFTMNTAAFLHMLRRV